MGTRVPGPSFNLTPAWKGLFSHSAYEETNTLRGPGLQSNVLQTPQD